MTVQIEHRCFNFEKFLTGSRSIEAFFFKNKPLSLSIRFSTSVSCLWLWDGRRRDRAWGKGSRWTQAKGRLTQCPGRAATREGTGTELRATTARNAGTEYGQALLLMSHPNKIRTDLFSHTIISRTLHRCLYYAYLQVVLAIYT